MYKETKKSEAKTDDELKKNQDLVSGELKNLSDLLQRDTLHQSSEYLEDYEASVQAGFIDSDKIQKYYKIRKDIFEKNLGVYPNFEQHDYAEESIRRIQRKLDLAHFNASNRGLVDAYYVGCEAQSVSWSSNDKYPSICYATAQHKVSSDYRLCHLDLDATIGSMPTACATFAMTNMFFRYTIPKATQEEPMFGKISVAPYIVALGKIWGMGEEKHFNGEGSAKIQIGTSLDFKEGNGEIIEGGNFSQGQTFLYLLRGIAKKLSGGFIDEINGEIVPEDFHVSRQFNEAHVSAFVYGDEVNISICITVSAKAQGRLTCSRLNFNEPGFLQVPFLVVNYEPFHF